MSLMTPAEEAHFYAHEYRKIYHGGDYDLDRFHRARQPDSDHRFARLRDSGLLRGRVLDVGCSTGNFLETIKPHVASIRGVEPDARQRDYAREKRGLLVADDTTQLTADERYDLITIFHTLEHIREPAEFLACVAMHLAKDGALVVEAPNVEDALIARYHLEEFATFYWHPAHSYYFSARTLAAVVQRAGLECDVTGVQRYTLANHLAWLRDRSPGGKTVDSSFVSKETERAFAADLCRTFACDTLWMVARRR